MSRYEQDIPKSFLINLINSMVIIDIIQFRLTSQHWNISTGKTGAQTSNFKKIFIYSGEQINIAQIEKCSSSFILIYCVNSNVVSNTNTHSICTTNVPTIFICTVK